MREKNNLTKKIVIKTLKMWKCIEDDYEIIKQIQSSCFKNRRKTKNLSLPFEIRRRRVKVHHDA